MSMSADQHNHSPDHRLERLMFFSDAVFAIAITLLVIELHIPDPGADAGNREWLRALIQLLPHLAAFTLSFFVIGAIWAAHHTMLSLVTGFDQRLIWWNLPLLLFIALLPFSTAIIATGSTASFPFAFYAGTLLLAAIFKARLTAVALRPDLIAPGISPARIQVELRRAWIMPIATLATFLLAFAAPGWNTAAMLLIPVARRLPMFRLPHEVAVHEPIEALATEELPA
jgi:uncharacterized membrane protein